MKAASPSPGPVGKRFRIAFSFAGEKRGFVEKVAHILAERFGKDAILYDKFHEAEFARWNLGMYLPKLYGEQSDLIVPVLCPSYDTKRWTGWEWPHIYGLLTATEGHRVMPSRFEYANADGLSPTAGFIELDDKTPGRFATLILERLAINEGQPKDHYAKAIVASHASRQSLDIPQNLPGGDYIGRLFIGRDDFLAKLRASLLGQTSATVITQSAGPPSPAPAATAIPGLGGIGKTHTAVAYADKFRGDYTALLFVSGETQARLNATLAGLCGVLHLDRDGTLPPDEPARVRAAIEWLAGHHGWLLIVDNVDDPAAAGALTQLLGQLTTGHVLITTRLHGWADNVTALDLSVLDPDSATELLLALTQSVHAGTAEDRAQARLLAADLGGLPLAIQQAAGYILAEGTTLAGARAFYLGEARDLLGWFDEMRIRYAAPEGIGPQPVLFTWKASFDRLAPDTRRWLRVFAHFAPDVIPDFLLRPANGAAEEVKERCRAARAAIAQADKYCLLTREREPAGFRLHRLVQHIIRLSASEGERATALAEGIQIIQESDPGVPQDVRSWARWNPLQAHAQGLCTHAPDAPAPEGLPWLLNQLALLLWTKSLYAQAEPLMRRALAIDEASFGKDHPNVAIRLNNLAQLLQDTNRLAEAEPLMRRALAIDEASFGKDHPNVATASTTSRSCSRPPTASRRPSRSCAAPWPSMRPASARTIPTSPSTSTTSRSCSRPRTGSPRPSR